MRCNQHFPAKFVFRWALLKAQAIDILIACVTVRRKVKKNQNIIQKDTSDYEDTSEIQFSFSDIQHLNECRSILDS